MAKVKEVPKEKVVEEAKARAVGKYIRIAPRKVQQVAELIRGAAVADAVNTLRFTTKASSKAVLKVLNSAVANARQNSKLREEDLYISEVYVDQGPTLKRFRPRAMGRATRIRKRTSHITIVVAEQPEKKATKVSEVSKVRKAEKLVKETKPTKPAKTAKPAKATKPAAAAKPTKATRKLKKEEKGGAKG